MELGTGMLAGSRKRKRTASPLPQMDLTICRGIDDFKVDVCCDFDPTIVPAS